MAIDDFFDDIQLKRTRSQKKILRVTFGDGTVFCYKSATMTYIETLRKIGIIELQKTNLEIGHLPLFSKEIYPKYKDYMKPLDDGWYVNIQSDSSQKYLQLTSIKNTLGLDMKIELGNDFETTGTKGFVKAAQKADCLLVKFPDGSFVGGASPKESFIEAMTKIGLEMLYHKEFEVGGREMVTRYQKYPNQIKTESGYWLTIPGQTKDKIKVFQAVKSRLRIDIETQII